MLAYVLGAPGTGKSTVAEHLTAELDGWVVLDWDYQLEQAGALAGKDLRTSPDLWDQYDGLMYTSVRAVTRSAVNCVVLGVRQPSEIPEWPVDAWVLLDCTDEVRAARLTASTRETIVGEAARDAKSYRQLGFVTVDSTSLSPADTAVELASVLNMLESRHRELGWT